MKSPSSNSIQLSRRLLANYLMFGLLSIVTLAVGMLVIVRASQAPTSGPRLLARLSEVSKRLTQDLAENDGQGIQPIIEELSKDSELQFCGVVGANGSYSAHTNPALTGLRGTISFSLNSVPGAIERVTFLREDQPGSMEYWLPLRRNDQIFGLLQARVHGETSPLTAMIGKHFGTVVALPVLLLLFGGSRLRAVIKASSTIDHQLTQLARDANGPAMQLQLVEDSCAATNGWNRLVQQMEKGQVLQNLESRLNDVLGGVQTQKYQQILQHMGEGVAVTDAEGVVTFANRAFGLLLETDEKSMIEQPLECFVPTGVPENLKRFTEQCRELSRPAVIEIYHSAELSDGVLRLARMPFQADESGTVHQIWSLRDISQLKLVEHTRDQFVDTATHELRTPLANIKACAETLELDDQLDEEIQKQYLNTIGSEATRLARFVDEFLNISRMEGGSVSLNRHSTNVERLIREAVEKTRPQFDQKQIGLELQMPAKMPELSIDKDKISAALVNLLGNAAKYTPEAGKVSLNVELAKSEIRIHVKDTGYGIAPEEVGNVFHRFFRSDDQRVRDTTGTGLGLSFAQEVVQLHGGSITVRSELNQGSQFTMTLPAI